jgi:glycosyltransferase involved in cell wall biosynthesis
MTPRFGIGITSRNRAPVLAHTLSQLAAHTPEPHRLAVVNDASEDGTAAVLAGLQAQHPDATVHDSPERLGVAKAKNRCLQALAGCEVIFLFDDDCYPVRAGWASLYAAAIDATGVQHFNFHDSRKHRLLKRTPRAGFTIGEFEPPGGVFMVLTRRVLEAVGAFNETYGLYGYEHETYTRRSFRAGLHGGLGLNLSLLEAEEYLLALDYRPEDGPFPELVRPHGRGFVSSVTQEEARLSVRQNARKAARDRKAGPIFLPFEGQAASEPDPSLWERWGARLSSRRPR